MNSKRRHRDSNILMLPDVFVWLREQHWIAHFGLVQVVEQHTLWIKETDTHQWGTVMLCNTMHYTELQSAAMNWNILSCNWMQCNIMDYTVLERSAISNAQQCTPMTCNALYCTAQQCQAINTLQYTTMNCNATKYTKPQSSAMHCNTMSCTELQLQLQLTEVQCNTLYCPANNFMKCNPFHCNATQCNPLSHKVDHRQLQSIYYTMFKSYLINNATLLMNGVGDDLHQSIGSCWAKRLRIVWFSEFGTRKWMLLKRWSSHWFRTKNVRTQDVCKIYFSCFRDKNWNLTAQK